MEVEIKKIKAVEEIVLTHATVPKGTNGELVITTDETGAKEEVIFAIPRKEGFMQFYTKCVAVVTPDISAKIKELERMNTQDQKLKDLYDSAFDYIEKAIYTQHATMNHQDNTETKKGKSTD